jgi:hypothetical protein
VGERRLLTTGILNVAALVTSTKDPAVTMPPDAITFESSSPARRARLSRGSQRDPWPWRFFYAEETMTITDPLTAQVADLHGMAPDIQSA